MLRMVSYPRRPQSGHITCYLNRTYHVLPTPSASAVDREFPSEDTLLESSAIRLTFIVSVKTSQLQELSHAHERWLRMETNDI